MIVVNLNGTVYTTLTIHLAAIIDQISFCYSYFVYKLFMITDQ